MTLVLQLDGVAAVLAHHGVSAVKCHFPPSVLYLVLDGRSVRIARYIRNPFIVFVRSMLTRNNKAYVRPECHRQS